MSAQVTDRKPQPVPSLLTIPETARVLRCSRQHAMDLATSGRLAEMGVDVVRVGRRLKVNLAQLEAVVGHPVLGEAA
ncbi:helix-turn-helix domain-containing protein [Pseudoclavibacter helvolus]|uniref:helix-turn-helix domain-containing protein n=1 Tax=Pseudoclavibacter helvolus TaxID=255205 RepID=UPI003C794112